MTQRTISKGKSIEDMPRVSEIVWRVCSSWDKPHEVKIVKRNPKSIDLLYVERTMDGRVYLWEVWRQYPDGHTLEVKSKREAWEHIIEWKQESLGRAKASVVIAQAALDRAMLAMDTDPEVY